MSADEGDRGRPSPNEQARRESGFPTQGAVLAGVVVTFAMAREFLRGDVQEHVFVTPAVILVGVLIDIVLLAQLSRRLDAARWTPLRSLLLLMGINLVLGVAYLSGIRAVGLAVGVAQAASVSELTVVRTGAMWSAQVFALWALAFRYPKVALDAHQRRQEAERLRAQAELAQLHAHLQPHFLRNTLNAIAALVADNPRESRRLLAMLGDLLSDSLESAGPTHTLDQEAAWMGRYSELLTTRYRGSLAFAWDVAPKLGGVMVPTLLLQPLVENAFIHGALCRDGDGEVAVRARACSGGGVEIIVEDNGPGLAMNALGHAGLGLHLVRRRLELECPGAQLRMESSPTGTRAIVRLP